MKCLCLWRTKTLRERGTSKFEGWVVLIKQPGRLLETDGCEGSGVKFRKCTITALFWVTRHGHSGIWCLCLQGMAVAPASACIWDGWSVWWEVRGRARGHSYMICGGRVQVQQPRPAGLEGASAAQIVLKHFLRPISTHFFPHLRAVHVNSKWKWLQ